MRIAMAQINFRVGDFEENARKIVEAIEKAKNAKADLAVFSELAVTGYYPHDLLGMRDFVEKAEQTIRQIAKSCVGIAALVGGPVINRSDRGKMLYNAAWFLAEGEVKDFFYKTLLPTYNVFDEYRHFEPNKEFKLLEFLGKKIAVTICEDVWDEQPTAGQFEKNRLYQISPLEVLSKLNPDIAINLSSSPFSVRQEDFRKSVVAAKARRFNLPLIYVNQVGANTEMIFDGGSIVLSPDGEIVHELKYFEEDFRVIDTDNLGQPQIQRKREEIEKIHDALVLGIGDYFRKSGFTTAALGLSGGLDSAVVAVLAARALGAQNVRCILMPSRYSSQHSIDDAVQLADNLNLPYDIIPINDAVETFEKGLEPLFAGLKPDVTEENIQSRTRGVYVMAVSNKFGNIVLNTSNKSECAVGYGTLYGDMIGGLSVLGDVFKTDVYRLAAFINKDSEIIPQNTILKPPSAELRPNQKDSDSLPEYSILDKILYHYIELNHSAHEISDLGYDRSLVEKVIHMVNINEYKRAQTPPILRISSKAFGFGRRMPIVAKY